MSKKNRARRQGLPVPLFPEGPRGFDLHWLHKENDGRHDRIGYVARRLPPDWPKRLQATQGYARQFNYGKGPRPLDERVSGTLWYPLHWSWRSDPKVGIIGYLNDVMQHHKLPGDEVGIGDSPEVSFRLDAIGRRPFPRAFPAPQILTTIYPDGEFARYLSTQFMGLVTLNAPGVRDGLPGPVALAIRGIPLSNGKIPEGLGDPTKLILLLDPLCVVVGIGEVGEVEDGVLFPKPGTAAQRVYHPTDDPWFSALRDDQKGYLSLWPEGPPGFLGQLGSFKVFQEGHLPRATPAPEPEPVRPVVPTHAVYAQALEAQIDLIRFMRSRHPFETVSRNNSILRGEQDSPTARARTKAGREYDDLVAWALERAHPVFWTADMLTVLEGLEPSLKTWTVQERDFVHPSGYVHFERPVRLVPGDPEVQVGYLWQLLPKRPLLTVREDREGPGYFMLPFTRYDPAPPHGALDLGNPRHGGPRTGFYLPIGGTLGQTLAGIGRWNERPDAADEARYTSGTDPDLDQKQQTRWIRIFAASIVLMGQRLTRLSDFRTDRAGRKRAQVTLQAEPPLIKTVLLRRVDYTGNHRTPKGESEPVNWSHRWMVSRHWREQWFPSEQRHKSIVIEAHVKGPADKPLWIPPGGEVDIIGR